MHIVYIVSLLLATITLASQGPDLHKHEANDPLFPTNNSTSGSSKSPNSTVGSFRNTTTVFASSHIKCHKYEDSIGQPCTFNEIQFKAAAKVWAGMYADSYIVPLGQSYVTRIAGFPCSNNKDYCDFWGNIRIDRDTDNRGAGNGWNYIDSDRCMEHIDDIWKTCGGYGGWYNTGYGTVFAECLLSAV